MNIESIKLVCFSPTGTTRAILEAIASGMEHNPVELIDITTPSAREQSLQTGENELLIVGAPVYMGRVPALATDWLQSSLTAGHTPAVGAVVYGNRAYENALLELTDVLSNRGCVPVAGAAYIGEHSFSTPEVPTAQGRPDEVDLHHAASLGRKIAEKLKSVSTMESISAIGAPGSRPYEGNTRIWDVDFIAVNDDCVQCGICAEGCPTGAINPDDSRNIDIVKCITCCACIKDCPQSARSIKAGPVKDAQARLHNLHSARKEPELYL